eukprot:gene56030-67023_t
MVIVSGTKPKPLGKMEEKRMKEAGETDNRPGPADGVYRPYIPTYQRKDGNMKLFYWGLEHVDVEGEMQIKGGRWCAADLSEKPKMWVIGRNCGGLFRLQKDRADGRPAWMMKRSGKDADLVLRFVEKMKCWVVCDVGKVVKAAYMCSTADGEGPHQAGQWAWGDKEGWHVDERVCVLSMEGETVREDANGMVWTEVEYGKEGWRTGQKVELKYDEPTARAELGVSVRQKAAVSSGEAQAAEDKMTRRELAGWHIIRNATGATPRAAELRKALAAVAQGATDSNELNVGWKDEFDAKASLSRIGRLIDMLKPPTAADPREPKNFDIDAPRFGHMQEKTIEGRIVNTRELQLADRKAFALALFEPAGGKYSGLQPHHFLDCTPNHNPDGTSNQPRVPMPRWVRCVWWPSSAAAGLCAGAWAVRQPAAPWRPGTCS